MTDEREAKALLKGQIRQTQNVADDIFRKRQSGRYSNARKNVRMAREFFNEELRSYGEFLISSVDFKSWGIGSTKHWKNEYTAIEPELIQAEGVGALCRFVVGYFDSKKFCKGELGYILKLTSQFYFHEHFLYRCIYRLNEKRIGNIGGFTYPIMEWLITENVPLSRIDNVNYFVYRDFTLVSEKLPNSYGLAFKTILETEQYTLEDKIKFQEAHKLLSESDSKSIKVVMTNQYGKVVRRIPDSIGRSFINSFGNNSFWLKRLLMSPDFRLAEL